MGNFKLTLLSTGIFLFSILVHTVMSQDFDLTNFLNILNESNIFSNSSSTDYDPYQDSGGWSHHQ